MSKKLEDKWLLKSGKVITDKEMTKCRMDMADLFDGKKKPKYDCFFIPCPPVAESIRRMTNYEFAQYFGLVFKKFEKKPPNR